MGMTTAASHPLSLHLLLTREDDGTWIASTDEALAYGSGPAPLDAALDCLDDLIELASALLADEGAGRLDPGRAEELAELRAWAGAPARGTPSRSGTGWGTPRPCASCGGSGQVDNAGQPYPPEVAATLGNDGAGCPDCRGTGFAG